MCIALKLFSLPLSPCAELNASYNVVWKKVSTRHGHHPPSTRCQKPATRNGDETCRRIRHTSSGGNYRPGLRPATGPTVRRDARTHAINLVRINIATGTLGLYIKFFRFCFSSSFVLLATVVRTLKITHACSRGGLFNRVYIAFGGRRGRMRQAVNIILRTPTKHHHKTLCVSDIHFVF